MRKMMAFAGFLCLLFASAGNLAPRQAGADQAFTLANEHWRVVLEPRWGGRASSLVSLPDNYDYVSVWGEERERRGRQSRAGGVFRGMMSGSYVSSQPDEPYEVVSRSATAAELRYDSPHPMLEGLREDKRIELSGRDVVLSVRVTNRSPEDRVIYYRFHDMTGIGRRQGLDSVYVIPRRDGRTFAFTAKPGQSVDDHFLEPEGNWYALADLVSGRGLAVRSSAPVASAYFWASRRLPFNPYMRTSELFFPQARLAPGQSWETEVRFTAFDPAAPETGRPELDRRLSASAIEGQLAALDGRALVPGLPYDAEMSVPAGGRRPLVIAPVHHSSPRLGGPVPPDYGRDLDRINLSGTPGEVLAFAFAVTAGEPVARGTVSFGELAGRWRRRIAADAFEPRYVAGETQLLVNDWELSRNIPLETISHTNNDVVDADALTPFSLERGETAWVWARLRIPENAAVGNYRAVCTVTTAGGAAARFEVALRVRPFRLLAADHKTWGTFFDYHIRPPDPDEMWEARRNAPYALSREEYRGVLRVFRDIGMNGMVIYVSSRDDLLWVLDTCAELGMKGDFVLIVPSSVRPADLAGRGMTAYGWTVDEPGSYGALPGVVRRYEQVLQRGLTPTFTPNVPVGLLIADRLEKMVPIINPNGNAPYLAAATRRYKDAGRKVFWYECDGLGPLDRSAERRALRGIYLWKEPVDGFWDWDNSSNRPNLSVHNLAGFAGTEVLPRLGLENIRQGLTDLRYLHTLETLAGRTRDRARRAEAEQLMDWIRARFETDYHDLKRVLPDAQYLDEVRNRVAEMIERL